MSPACFVCVCEEPGLLTALLAEESMYSRYVKAVGLYTLLGWIMTCLWENRNRQTRHRYFDHLGYLPILNHKSSLFPSFLRVSLLLPVLGLVCLKLKCKAGVWRKCTRPPSDQNCGARTPSMLLYSTTTMVSCSSIRQSSD